MFIALRTVQIFTNYSCLKNAPSTFQRAMDIIPLRFKWQLDLVHLVDVVIFSRSVKNI